MTAGDAGAEWFDLYVAWFRAMAADFAEERMRADPAFPAEAWLRELILDLVLESDYVRAICGYAGWLCGEKESAEIARTSVGLELMYLSASVHDASGTDAGVTDAIGGVLLNWSERLLQGPPRTQELVRDWRDEITVARLAEVTGSRSPDVADSSVVRSLQFGATLAGCSQTEATALAIYGHSVTRVLQLPDGATHHEAHRLLDTAAAAVTGRVGARGQRLLATLAERLRSGGPVTPDS